MNLGTPNHVLLLLKSTDLASIDGLYITEHFTWSEALGNLKVSESKEVTHAMLKNVFRMAQYMERVRTYFGQPLVITSWLRPPSYNKRVGGAPKSWHMTGLAVDFYLAKKGTLNSAELARFNAFHKGGLGQNRDKGFIHIDLGPERIVPYS